MERSEVLVLGATGLVGQYVLSELNALGHRVVAVARNPAGETDPSVRWIKADLTRPDDVSRLPSCERAISTIAIWMTADVMPQLASRGLRRLVAFSSSSAETKTDAADQGERELAARLRAGEARVQALAPGLRSTLLRPTMIYGRRGDANVERIAGQLARFRVFPLVGRGVGLRQPVHGQDLAAAATSALFAPAAEDHTYTVAGGEVLTVREMVTRVGAANGVRARFVQVPVRPATRALQALGKLPKFRHVPAGALERMVKDLVFDNARATTDFGYAPRGFEPPDYR